MLPLARKTWRFSRRLALSRSGASAIATASPPMLTPSVTNGLSASSSKSRPSENARPRCAVSTASWNGRSSVAGQIENGASSASAESSGVAAIRV
jgi:hypothetical protein